MVRELKFRIVLENPPAGVDFALQKGRGNDPQIVQKQRSATHDLVFEFTASVKAASDGAAPSPLLGPFVQGPPGARFVYIGIGVLAGQTDTPWNRRLKVPLSGITSDVLDQIAADPRAVLETRVPGTGTDGGPNCATVKPFSGRKLVRPTRK